MRGLKGMRWLLPCLMLACGLISAPSVASSQELTPDEGRLILGQLYELKSARTELEAYREHVERDALLDIRERDNAARALELERRATSIAEQERDLERDRAETNRALYESVTKGRSWQCKVAKVFTLGLARCR